jgi:UDP-2-acetamido-3-amino-2,3-dideoxy-glucuronate N-acetyltransferase
MDNKIMIHPLSDVQCKNIGEGTRIWQYTVVLKDAFIGKNCNICSHCFIENDVKVGDNVTLKFYVELCDGVTLEDDVFIAPNVSFTNDLNPRSKKFFNAPERTLIKKGASIGAGVAIKPGVTIGEYAFVALGSVVTKDIPAYTFWMGSPAKHMGYVTKECEIIDLNFTSKKTNKKYHFVNNEIVEKND